MYGYKDYYDEALRKKPYTDSREAMEDYRALIELMLEDMAGVKGIGTEDGLFSKGMVISEREMQEYFVNHPALRNRDSYFYIVGNNVEEALSHIESRQDNTSKDVFLPIRNIVETFNLDKIALVAILLAYLSHTERGYERVYGFLQDDIEAVEPTLGLVCSLILRDFSGFSDTDIIGLLSDASGLFGSIFMAEGIDYIYPFRTRLILTKAALAYINGDDLLTDYCTKYSYGLINIYDVNKEPEFFAKETKLLSELIKRNDEITCLYIESDDGNAVIHIAAKAAAKQGKRLAVISALDVWKAEEEVLSDIKAMLSFYGRMDDIIFLINKVTDAIVRDKVSSDILKELIAIECLSPILITGSNKAPKEFKNGVVTGTPVLHITFAAPDVNIRTAIWNYYIKEAGLSKEKELRLDDIADCYEAGYSDIRTAVSQARLNMLSGGIKKLNKDTLTDTLKEIGTVNFDGLAKEVRTVYTWEDLCIGEGEVRILRTACDRYKIKNRIGEQWGISKKNAYGNGVSVLLYGPPGTGKTMSAQVIAREIGLPLYRVDTSQLFSKYIGETQKNLNAVFDEAEKSNVILFFDEADALFSKRTEVENSNDRHANQEIAFLLQRIEEYKGMSILATNFYSGFDKAFVRRITYACRLEQPDYETRLALWKNTLPNEVPEDKGIDYEFLAKNFELTGSNIKAILLSAAYMAGAQEGELTMAYIVRAMKYEFDKLGMMPDSGKFGPYAVYLA